MVDNEQNDAAAKRHRQKAIRIWFWSLTALSLATWMLLQHLPTTDVCYFRDVWYLRLLWPANIAVLDQIKTLSYSENDQCIFFAARSVESVYMAVFFGVVLFLGRRVVLRESWSLPAFTLMSLFVLIAIVFFDKFDDNVHGRGAWTAFHTYDPIWVLFVKTIVRMVVLYLLLAILALHFNSYLKRRKDRA